MSLETIIYRQFDIANNNAVEIELPKYKIYAMCNLRGGIGKTTLSFNLSYLADDLLAVDTCPQGNLSYFYDKDYYAGNQTNVKDMLLPYLVPGLGKATRVASFIGATNEYFSDKNNFYIPSSEELYLLPSQLITAINQTAGLQQSQKQLALKSILYSLETEIKRELSENSLDKCIIDTSPFFAGATQLAWYAADALVIPVRTDQQSIKSLELLINILTNPQSEFRKYLPENDMNVPKIQMVVLTHCGWSTVAGARNEPNQQTKLYLKKVYDILSKNRTLLSTRNPENHLFMLDDFLGSGRISSFESKPMELLKEGETKVIDRLRVSVNKSVDKCKNQLKFISNQLW
ncbi:ParA family protein [Taurinivorans muris]|uniref:ParA family protein n=1 Tax=Taurinivorans muris TaxID=2787751 RepID=A0ABY5XZL8_9BACT|nr:ParA family protein [Desulfovibrionaceae bacterium LT0009]